MKYVSLHNHTNFSMYDGLGYPKEFYDAVLKNGGDAMAITEHGSMNSLGYAVSAAKDLRNKGAAFRPIFGVEAYVLPSIADWHALKAGADTENATVIENELESKSKHYDPIKRRHHLVIIALNSTGLQNLFTLVSLSYRQESFYRFPRMDFDMLRKFNDGLAISTACLAGLPTWLSMRHPEPSETRQALVMDDYATQLSPLLDIFGRDRAFLELQFNALPEQHIVNADLIAFSKQSGYKLIVASDAHYCRPELWKEREVYKALGRRMTSSEFDVTSIPQALSDLECELYPHSATQIWDAFKRYQPGLPEDTVRDAINRTHDIAWQLAGDVQPDASTKLPSFVPLSPAVKTPFQQLSKLCQQALRDKGLAQEPYISRTLYELQIIKDKDVAAYFLTKKAILDCLRKELLLGVGRGSGAGSLVCFLLGITLADPIKGNLLFERFMSPSRAEMPDIDSDCEDKDKAFELLKASFGEHNVLAISNYNRLTLKTLVKDVARLYGVPFEEANAVTKVVESEAKDSIMAEIGNDQKLYELTFTKAYQFSPTFQAFIDKYPNVGECLSQLHKSVKAISRHAGGVLIVPDAHKHLPIIRIKNTFQSPFSEGLTAQHLKHFGLIKFDVLGLSTLRIIRRCIELVLRRQGQAITMENVQRWYDTHLHPDVIDPADQRVFRNVYHDGRFLSTFQFAESGVQSFCKKAKPCSVTELAAVTSLWRPGALQSQGDQKYLNFDADKFAQEHPVIQEVLADSRGVIILQEQFMLLAHKLAGFTLDEADKLRKLLVKPSNELGEELKQQRIKAGERFIAGAIAHGMSAKRAHSLWHDEILSFISYGFNRAHAYVYAFNSYHCAWLFTYHQTEWIKACLEKDPDLEKTVNAVSSLGYTIQKPDVNLSLSDEWQIIGNACLPPFTSLKGIGAAAADELITERGEGFKDLRAFFYRQDANGHQQWRWSKFNKTSLRVLVQLEALDSLMCVGEDEVFKNYHHMESVLFHDKNFDKLKKGVIREGRGKKAVVTDLSIATLPEADKFVSDWSTREKLDMQLELTGIFDKMLLFTPQQRMLMAQHSYKAFTLADAEPSLCWFFLDKTSAAVTESGKVYAKLQISDGHAHKRFVNIFDNNVPEIPPKSLCVAKLVFDGDWLNLKSRIHIIPP